jgi:hypothetical protein
MRDCMLDGELVLDKLPGGGEVREATFKQLFLIGNTGSSFSSV